LARRHPQSLEKLTSLDPHQGRVVELRYFGSFHSGNGRSHGHFRRDCQTARLWLTVEPSAGVIAPPRLEIAATPGLGEARFRR
jgi:hypothetical protein